MYQAHTVPGANIGTLGPYFNRPHPRLTAIFILSPLTRMDSLLRQWHVSGSIRTRSHPWEQLGSDPADHAKGSEKIYFESPPYLKNHNVQRSEASATHGCVSTTLTTRSREGMMQKAKMSITQWESLLLQELEGYGLPITQWWITCPILGQMAHWSRLIALSEPRTPVHSQHMNLLPSTFHKS